MREPVIRRGIPLAIVICLAVAAPAQARIVINKRIGAARLSLSDKQVIDRFGQPDDITYGGSQFGPSKTFHYFARKLRVSFYDIEEPRVAWKLRTASGGERTSSGLGVGSSVRAVRRKLSEERCHVQAGNGSCQVVHRKRFDDRKTIFSFSGGRVASVTIRFFY
jgi:hypothetical protein